MTISPMNLTTGAFPSNLLLDETGRGQALLRDFYGQHHERRNYGKAQHEREKAGFFTRYLLGTLAGPDSLGVDLGCRGGALTRRVGAISWVGVDVDAVAVGIANASGVPCIEMDIGIGIDFQDDAFDAVMMTEVLEHLAYPVITVKEVHRILKKNPDSAFFGSVPLDYHLHRRWKVMRGKRLSGDPTHIHHFSFTELDHLLRFYFHRVEYLPLRGTAARHPGLRLPFRFFLSDVAWIASAPKLDPGRWNIAEVL